jgi:RimJ/RimL family protein N-acetyltransferase
MQLDNWKNPPSLCGRFVMLRPTVMADIQGLALAHDDPDTMKFFPYGIESKPPNRESVENALCSGRQVLTQLDARNGHIIGTTSIYNMDKTHRRVTVGYTWISEVVRGSVINLESKLLLLDHIFGTLGATSTEFNVDNLNVRSQRAILALGATEEGHLRKHARRRDGSWRTTVVFSVIEDDWPAVRANIENRISQRRI